VATDSAGNVYVADTYNFLIRCITPAGVVSTIGGGASPGFSYPTGVAVDSATNVYVADYDNQIIRVITPGGVVYTLAGELDLYGDGDGISPQATFDNPWGVAVDSASNVYVGDSGNGNIRKIINSKVLSTLAGPDESHGVNTDGPEGQPRFNQPNGVAVDDASNLYVADSLNNCIRIITPAGTVTTLAGSVNGYSGSADGTNTRAEFNNPTGLCLDAATNIYVADYDNSTVRKITPINNGDWVTTTIAGQAGCTPLSIPPPAPTRHLTDPTPWRWTARRTCM
jgi:sugar lactone lactonase YvrE